MHADYVITRIALQKRKLLLCRLLYLSKHLLTLIKFRSVYLYSATAYTCHAMPVGRRGSLVPSLFIACGKKSLVKCVAVFKFGSICTYVFWHRHNEYHYKWSCDHCFILLFTQSFYCRLWYQRDPWTMESECYACLVAWKRRLNTSGKLSCRFFW